MLQEGLNLVSRQLSGNGGDALAQLFSTPPDRHNHRLPCTSARALLTTHGEVVREFWSRKRSP